jgi:hypothetical protein
MIKDVKVCGFLVQGFGMDCPSGFSGALLRLQDLLLVSSFGVEFENFILENYVRQSENSIKTLLQEFFASLNGYLSFMQALHFSAPVSADFCLP